MPGLRYADLVRKPMDVLDMTSLTSGEFKILAPPFEAAFQAHMAEWRLDGKPRTARRFTTYKNCPLPTPEDRLSIAELACRLDMPLTDVAEAVAPLFAMMEPNDASHAPKMQMSRKAAIAARKSAIPLKTSC